MRIISTKEEREQLIESLVNEETNLFPLDKKDCDYLKDAQTVIEYTFRTNLLREGDRVSELLKIVSKVDLSAIKGFHHLCFIIRSSLTYEITMNEMSDICKDREALRPKYEQFVQTERGKEWKHFWQSQTGSERSGDFGDYLYDFYPEMLM